MRLQVCILTPDRVFRNKELEELILPTTTGEMGVLSGHAPLITSLDIGVIMLRNGSDSTVLALMGGFALVENNQVTIIVNEAIGASSIDCDGTEKALKDSTNRLNESREGRAKIEATLAYKRARALYRVANWDKANSSLILAIS